ncbi:MAG: Nif3-like dinuclear metal center hexameric protein [Gemmatimonadota bacterium]|nr:Nif3-like dinuclear metal center hexameric protein [Gemmatimonadota bacterium]
MGVAAREIARWWDDYLRVDEIDDYPGALNGLQVEAPRSVTRVGAATDACQATIDAAVEDGCELLLVHHGLFWGSASPLTGALFRRVRSLISAETGLYSAHLPLDVHEEVGNNVLLAQALELSIDDRFGSHGSLHGIGVVTRPGVSRDALRDRIAAACGGGDVMLIPGGPADVETLAIVTGGAGSMIAEAAAAGVDAFLTGEGNHHTYHEAIELGINVYYAGHYATETFGVRALAERTADRFGIEHRFYDNPTGL